MPTQPITLHAGDKVRLTQAGVEAHAARSALIPGDIGTVRDPDVLGLIQVAWTHATLMHHPSYLEPVTDQPGFRVGQHVVHTTHPNRYIGPGEIVEALSNGNGRWSYRVRWQRTIEHEGDVPRENPVVIHTAWQLAPTLVERFLPGSQELLDIDMAHAQAKADELFPPGSRVRLDAGYKTPFDEGVGIVTETPAGFEPDPLGRWIQWIGHDSVLGYWYPTRMLRPEFVPGGIVRPPVDVDAGARQVTVAGDSIVEGRTGSEDRGRPGGVLWCGHWSADVTPGKSAILDQRRYAGPSETALCPVCVKQVGIRDANVYEFEHVPSDRRLCPDAGVCHHDCKPSACYRVRSCAPLSGVFVGDRWPDNVVAKFDERAVSDPDPLLGFGNRLREQDPELVAQFDGLYEEPGITRFEIMGGPVLYTCERCGVSINNPTKHRSWHYEVSLVIWSLGSLLRTVAEG